MGLIIPDLTTLEGKQTQAALIISKQIEATNNSVAAQVNGLKNIVFRNPSGLTPQQVCDAIGTDAVKVMQAWQAAYTMIQIFKPGGLSMEVPTTADGRAQTIVPNQDGTVTIVVS